MRPFNNFPASLCRCHPIPNHSHLARAIVFSSFLIDIHFFSRRVPTHNLTDSYTRTNLPLVRGMPQIVVEVHDVDDRLAATIELLQSKTVAFDEVCWDSQRTSEVRGYVMVVPEALNMFLVFAKRRQKVSGADSTPPTAVDGCGKNSHEVDDNIGSGTAWSSAGEEKRRCDVGKPPRFCSCGSASRTVGS